MDSVTEHVALSVIVCAHNPREQYLASVLNALRAQSLTPDRWELVIVDNASTKPLAPRLDLKWHPRARVLLEPRLGLTTARLRGIQECAAMVLVFVDDDNELRPDYFERAWELGASRPNLGAWGGRVTPRFERPPPEWTRPYWDMLAIKEVSEETISRDPRDWPSTPVGAGLCVRREVARCYQEQLKRHGWRLNLGRRGQNLMSAEDQDMVATACDMGMEKGVFPSLQLDHLLPPERLTEPYLLRLNAAMEFSNWMFWWIRQPGLLPSRWTPWRWWRHAQELLRLPPRERRFLKARMQGQRAALRFRRLLLRKVGEADLAEFIEAETRRSSNMSQ